MTKGRILITCQSYGWFKRHYWQLSSILEQVGDIPPIRIRIHTWYLDPFLKLGQDMIVKFRALGLDIEQLKWDSDTEDEEGFAYRSNIRTWDYNNLPDDCEWLLFTDPDMVYHPQFFETFKINIDKMSTFEKCIAICREMCEVPDKVIDAENYNEPIKDVIEKIKGYNQNPKRIDTKKASPSSLGVGFFQLLHIPRIKELGITNYGTINADKNIHHPKRSHFRTFSDKSVRKTFGILGTRLFRPVYHLNHSKKRDINECY